MAKLTMQQIKEIVERDMPGFTVIESGPAVDTAAHRPEAAPDAVSPDIEELRRLFLGADAAAPGPYYGGRADVAEKVEPGEAVERADDGCVVLTRPIGPPADPAEGPGPKAVVISHGKVIAKQG